MFLRHLGEVIDRARARDDFGYAVLFLDLNCFKWVNDSLGHTVGDRLLVEIAHRLEDQLASEMLIARHGGDEFTLMPDGPCDESRALDLANRVLRVFEQPFLVNGQEIYSGASIGLVLGRPEYESPEQLIRDADTAMYQAKGQGRSKLVLFDDAMHRQARRRLRLENDLRRAFDRGEFRLFFQPVVDIGSGRIAGAEALVRWQHPSRGLLVPADFLQIAEETGDITSIDGWVLEESVRWLARWRARHPGLFVNVNVDERQIASAEVVADVHRLLHAHGLAPDALRLEVTESAFRAGAGPVADRLVALKALGIGLVVDDFGTGYSSLEAFAASPFDGLKIDQAFVRDMHVNPRHRAIVRTIVAFADELSLALTAEGVEDAAALGLLRAMGCRFGQGYFFSRPVEAVAFEQLLDAPPFTIGRGGVPS
jgi:diguanylate cyclase (GGDEF)-like protein